jgi:hypothetical protein
VEYEGGYSFPLPVNFLREKKDGSTNKTIRIIDALYP